MALTKTVFSKEAAICVAGLFFCSVTSATGPASSSCRLQYFTQKQLSDSDPRAPEIRALDQGTGKILKKAFGVLKAADNATLGLLSALTLKGALSYEDIQGDDWDKIKIVGTLMFQDAPFSASPIRGAKITMKSGEGSTVVTSGTDGEFREYFYKIVPFKRLRLFPYPIFEVKQKAEKIIKLPLTIEVDSKVCKGQLRMAEVPLDPVVVFATSGTFKEGNSNEDGGQRGN